MIGTVLTSFLSYMAGVFMGLWAQRQITKAINEATGDKS